VAEVVALRALERMTEAGKSIGLQTSTSLQHTWIHDMLAINTLSLTVLEVAVYM
jgi:hypothetical protein